jgi:hypothetical protein
MDAMLSWLPSTDLLLGGAAAVATGGGSLLAPLLKGWGKWALIGLAALGLCLTIYLGYRYVENMQQRAEQAAAEQARLELTLQVERQRAESIIAELQRVSQEVGDNNRRLEALQADARSARTETKRLTALFAKHNLGKLADEKPGLLESRINAASDRTRRLLESISGNSGDGQPGKTAPAN